MKGSLIILNNKNRFLLQLRDNKPNIAYPNYWGFIGGGIERGETPRKAIERECLEEIGVSPRNIQFLNKIFIYNPWFGKQEELFAFKGKINKEPYEITLTEGQRVEYFYFHEIQDLKIPPPIKNFLLENKRRLF